MNLFTFVLVASSPVIIALIALIVSCVSIWIECFIKKTDKYLIESFALFLFCWVILFIILGVIFYS